jgi:hypothetical protein
MKKSSKRESPIKLHVGKLNVTAMRQEAELLAVQMQIPVVVALELVEAMAAKRREKTRKDSLREVLKLLSAPIRRPRKSERASGKLPYARLPKPVLQNMSPKIKTAVSGPRSNNDGDHSMEV